MGTKIIMSLRIKKCTVVCTFKFYLCLPVRQKIFERLKKLQQKSEFRDSAINFLYFILGHICFNMVGEG